MKRPKPKLKGYRVRVVIDIPVWEYYRTSAKTIAANTAKKCHTASKVISVEVIREGKPDSRDLFPEDYPPFNPSKRGSK